MNKEELKEGKSKSKFLFIKKFFILLFLVLIIFGGYARFIGTSGLVIKEYSVVSERLPESFDGLKVVHFSDIHFGSIIGEDRLKKIVNSINELKPDLVIFTGDLYDESIKMSEDDKKTLSNILKDVNAVIGKYAVSGNHDYSDDSYIDIMNKGGFTYLNSEEDVLYYKGSIPIRIVGFPSYINDEPNYIEVNDDYFTITLLHEPDGIDNLKYKSDVIMAGHSHGGQVRLPVIGALYTPYGAEKYYDEFYKTNKGDLYISSGLGTSILRLRYFNHPSINLYRFFTK